MVWQHPVQPRFLIKQRDECLNSKSMVGTHAPNTSSIIRHARDQGKRPTSRLLGIIRKKNAQSVSTLRREDLHPSGCVFLFWRRVRHLAGSGTEGAEHVALVSRFELLPYGEVTRNISSFTRIRSCVRRSRRNHAQSRNFNAAQTFSEPPQSPITKNDQSVELKDVSLALKAGEATEKGAKM